MVKKRMLSVLLALALLAAAVFPAAAAQSGICGEDVRWSLSAAGVLTVSGSGEMDSYSRTAAAPWAAESSRITQAVLADGVTSVGSYAFFGCDRLTAVTLGKDVGKIGANAFLGCERLTQITVNAVNPAYSSVGGVLLNKAQTELVRVPEGRQESYTAPSTVTSIAYAALASCKTLPDVTLPESLKSIGGSAFEGCTGLKRVVIPNNVTALAAQSFYGCTALHSVCFQGTAPQLAGGVFDAPAGSGSAPVPGLTLYYLQGKTGWTSPLWKGYSARPWDGVVLPFTDVPLSRWYYGAVQYAFSQELFAGISADTFAPDGDMTRAMLVSVLWRLENRPAPGKDNPFTDVIDGQWYTDAVVWAAENALAAGDGKGFFNPNGKVSREQIAVFMCSYARYKQRDVSERADLTAFPDSGSVASWARDALSWANAEGLITGAVQNGKTLLLPQGRASRAQVAAILQRYASE